MVQKRPFEVGEANDISSKLLRQDPCDKLSLFSDISSFGDANHVSGISARGGFTEGKLVYDEELPSIEKYIKHYPGREDDPDGSLPGRHSFSSGGTSSTSEEDVWIETPFNTCFFPDFYPERPVTTLTRREDIYSLLLVPPQKQVPIGPLHQADIPPLMGDGDDLNPVYSPAAIEDEDEVEEPLSGTSILPMPTATSSSEDVVKPGHGRTDCSCLNKGSIRCAGLHVMEARDKLKIRLGVQVFEELGFSDMGEQVAEKWTEEEENLFHEVVFSNPSSMGRNFWNCLSHEFLSRTKAEIVSYYFSVFMLRKRAEQNRFDPVNVNSDNDEWQAIEEEDEYSVVESPFYQLHPVDGSGYNSDECQNENLIDEACDDDNDSGPHIGRVDDSQANSDFQPVQNTWYETERSYHGTQDDSCTSFNIGTTMPATRVKFYGGVFNDDMVDTTHVALLRSEVDLVPTFSRIEEVFRDKLPGLKGEGSWLDSSTVASKRKHVLCQISCHQTRSGELRCGIWCGIETTPPSTRIWGGFNDLRGSGGRMSSGRSCSEIDELLEIGMRCKELRKEKELLRESQSQSFDLIKKIERHVSSLFEGHVEDLACIKQFERELSNCSQEIDYLQDQLTSRDTEVSCLEEQVRMLELRISDMQRGQDEVYMLREELKRSDEERDILLHELEKKDLEHSSFALCIEKLEESISSMSLESQCEIESLKFDLRKWEHMYSETNEVRKKAVRDKESTSQLLAALGEQLDEAQGIVNHLEEENKELRERPNLSEKNAGISSIIVDEHISNSIYGEENPNSSAEIPCEEPRFNPCTCSMIGLGPPEMPSQSTPPHPSDATLKEKIEEMSRKIKDYELLVKQLKEELRQEKLKAKEEAEDMAQEMAELRYQMTELLEEECKRRASVEQLCLQRIVELEAQVKKEQRNSAGPLSIVTAQKVGYL